MGPEVESHSLNVSLHENTKYVDKESHHAVSEQFETASKLLDRQVGSWSIKGNLVNNGRCPKCTLKIPCKHYDRVEDLPAVVHKQTPRVAGSKDLPPLPPSTKASENLVPAISATRQRK